MPIKDFNDALDYLYTRLPMFQRQGAAALKKDLTNTLELCWRLGLPQWKFPSVHIAGTNGKGSVSSMLAAILQSAGFRTGLYTSPHLKSFTERIRINGEPIGEADVVAFVKKIQPDIEVLNPSFFEVTVAMAFEYFVQQKVDIAIIEVGLGGRLDSTNVIYPELSVITNIGWDHMDLLGDTLDKIALEKAGIIKQWTPVVVGEALPETRPVFEAVAQNNHAPLIFAAEKRKVTSRQFSLDQQVLEISCLSSAEKTETYTLDLIGVYQQENVLTALSAVDELLALGWKIPQHAIKKGLRSVRTLTGLRGRMDILGKRPTVIADTAHNEPGVKAVLEQLATFPAVKRHFVWGMVSDKDHAKVLALLPKEAIYYFVKPDIPRGLNEAIMQEKAQAFGLRGEAYPSVAEGKKSALLAAGPDDLIYLGGSTFVVAEALD